MSAELQDKLVKMLGAIVQAAIAIACVKLIPNQPEMIAVVLSSTGIAVGGVALNTPIKAVRRAKGLVSVRTPTPDETESMRAAVLRVDSQRPPEAQP